MKNKLLLFITLIFILFITIFDTQFNSINAGTRYNYSSLKNDSYKTGSSNFVENADDNTITPGSFDLLQNYPNPFNPSTIIKYSIPDEDHITIKVYNSLGNEVATLINKTQEAGNHTVIFNGEDLSSGVYFAQLKAENFTKVIKMILVK